jgi:DNA-binding NarL/FixJ family response regulator
LRSNSLNLSTEQNHNLFGNTEAFLQRFDQTAVYMEDEPNTRENTQIALEEKGMIIKSSETEKQILDHAVKSSTDKLVIYILDINMGKGKDYEGLKIARRLKKIRKNCFVVLLSSKLKDISEEDLESTNADCVVEKNNSIAEDVDSIIGNIQKIIKDPSIPSLPVPRVRKQNEFTVNYSESTLTSQILRKIDDPYIPTSFINNNIATNVLCLNINSKKPVSAEKATEILTNLSNIKINIPYPGDFSAIEKDKCGLMILFPNTGRLYSFGTDIVFKDNYVSTTPDTLDFLDLTCHDSGYGSNDNITINIECYIFGIFI